MCFQLKRQGLKGWLRLCLATKLQPPPSKTAHHRLEILRSELERVRPFENIYRNSPGGRGGALDSDEVERDSLYEIKNDLKHTR